MTNKNKVIAITFPKHSLVANIHQFQQILGIKTETEAAREIIERYFALTYKQREELEEKIGWQQHRNKGHRRLTSLVPNLPKTKYKKPVVQSAPVEKQPETKQTDLGVQA